MTEEKELKVELKEDTAVDTETVLVPKGEEGLKLSTKNLIDTIIEENDTSKLQNLTHLFKIHAAKRNLIRLIKYYDMLDLVNEQAMKRLEKRPDEIDNKDLLAFMNTLLNTVEKTTTSLKVLDDTESLIINHQSNEVNINVNTGTNLTRESKEKVVDAIKSLMVLLSDNSPIKADNIVDVTNQDEEDEE